MTGSLDECKRLDIDDEVIEDYCRETVAARQVAAALDCRLALLAH
jgi:hypothetical protein